MRERRPVSVLDHEKIDPSVKEWFLEHPHERALLRVTLRRAETRLVQLVATDRVTRIDKGADLHTSLDVNHRAIRAHVPHGQRITGPGVRIAILDTGIHRALGNELVPNIRPDLPEPPPGFHVTAVTTESEHWDLSADSHGAGVANVVLGASLGKGAYMLLRRRRPGGFECLENRETPSRGARRP
ncbi:hypothetical protein CMK11_14630 [Candidatus Poribacteria bacterium]|nr:hypothetical protein [Candidatus Poribacteria bacterium]